MNVKRQILLAKLYVAQNGVCGICGHNMRLTECNIDHRKPKCQGGTDAKSNLQAAHITCNSKKGEDENPNRKPAEKVPYHWDEYKPLFQPIKRRRER